MTTGIVFAMVLIFLSIVVFIIILTSHGRRVIRALGL